MADLKSNKENIKEAVLEVQIVKKMNIMGYFGDNSSMFLLVKIALPRLAAACKRLMERGVVYPKLGNDYQFFESNIDFDIRYCNINVC